MERPNLCANCGRVTLTQPHKPGCLVLQHQTELKCREFGMAPYYTEARPFPRYPP